MYHQKGPADREVRRPAAARSPAACP